MVGTSPKKFAAQNVKISTRFQTASCLHIKYLRKATRYRQNCVANDGHSRTCVLNFVNFGPQTKKNWTRVTTHSQSTFSDSHISGAGMGLPQQHFCRLKFENWFKKSMYFGLYVGSVLGNGTKIQQVICPDARHANFRS